MRSLNPRSLNPSLLNSCFTAGKVAPIFFAGAEEEEE